MSREAGVERVTYIDADLFFLALRSLLLEELDAVLPCVLTDRTPGVRMARSDDAVIRPACVRVLPATGRRAKKNRSASI